MRMNSRLEYTQGYQDLLRRCGMLEISRRVANQKGVNLLFVDAERAKRQFAEARRLNDEIVKTYGDMIKLQIAGKALAE